MLLNLNSLFLVNNTTDFPLVVRLDILGDIFIIINVSKSLFASTTWWLVWTTILARARFIIVRIFCQCRIPIFAILWDSDMPRYGRTADPRLAWGVYLYNVLVDNNHLFLCAISELRVLLSRSSTRKTYLTIRILDVLVNILVQVIVLADATCLRNISWYLLSSFFFYHVLITVNFLQIDVLSVFDIAVIELSLVKWDTSGWICWLIHVWVGNIHVR